MTVQLNHTIVFCRDQQVSATFLAEILGRPAPKRFGPFFVVDVDNGVSLDFDEVEGEVAFGHYAFLVGEAFMRAAEPGIELERMFITN